MPFKEDVRFDETKCPFYREGYSRDGWCVCAPTVGQYNRVLKELGGRGKSITQVCMKGLVDKGSMINVKGSEDCLKLRELFMRHDNIYDLED